MISLYICCWIFALIWDFVFCNGTFTYFKYICHTLWWIYMNCYSHMTRHKRYMEYSDSTYIDLILYFHYFTYISNRLIIIFTVKRNCRPIDIPLLCEGGSSLVWLLQIICQVSTNASATGVYEKHMSHMHVALQSITCYGKRVGNPLSFHVFWGSFSPNDDSLRSRLKTFTTYWC